MNITFCRRASHSRALAFLDRAKKPLRKSHDEKRAVRSECSPPVRAAAITITRSPLLKRIHLKPICARMTLNALMAYGA